MILFVVICGSFLMLSSVLFKTGNRKGSLFSIDNIFLYAYVVFWGIVFPINYIFSIGNTNLNTNAIISSVDAWEVLSYYICVFIVLVAIVFLFRNRNRQLFSFYIGSTNQNKLKNEKEIKRLLDIIILFLFILGIVCDYLYLRAYGGYFNYLNYSGMIRSGVFVISNRFSFLIPFRSLTKIVSFLLFVQITSKDKRNLNNCILFVLSFAHSCMVLYSNRGRLAMALYFLFFILYILIKRKNNNNIDVQLVIKLFLLTIVLAFMLVFVGNLLKRNDLGNVFEQINKEISFVFSNFIILSKAQMTEFVRYGLDCIIWPMYLLPTSIWQTKIGIRTASDFMTFLTVGGYKGDVGIYGEIPTDLISTAYMQFGVWGVFLYAYIWALWGCFILKWIENRIQDYELKNGLKVYVLISYFLQSILYGDPVHIVRREFPFIVFMVVYSVALNIIQKKR